MAKPLIITDYWGFFVWAMETLWKISLKERKLKYLSFAIIM